MEHWISGGALVLIGFLIIRYRKEFMDDIAKTNNVGFGFRKYGPKEIESGQRSLIGFGIFIICAGIAALIGIF